MKNLRIASTPDPDPLKQAIREARAQKPHIAHSVLSVTIGQEIARKHPMKKIKQD